ncbi:MAG: hypothetical protein GY920_09980 [Aliivibrio sp.]|nr:hypothetical protein [Aliivibrio sp.]
MNVNDAITKLRVLLGAETEEVVEIQNEEKEEETKVEMAEATLVDGTEVYTEGELQPGAILFVRAGEGADEDPFAPAGLHETTEGLLITVGENGEISSIEEKAEENIEAKEEKEEEVAMAFSSQEFLSEIAGIIKPYTEEISTLKEELNTLTERFEAIADQPATKKIRNNFSEEAKTIKNRAEARYEKLVEIRKNK